MADRKISTYKMRGKWRYMVREDGKIVAAGAADSKADAERLGRGAKGKGNPHKARRKATRKRTSHRKTTARRKPRAKPPNPPALTSRWRRMPDGAYKRKVGERTYRVAKKGGNWQTTSWTDRNPGHDLLGSAGTLEKAKRIRKKGGRTARTAGHNPKRKAPARKATQGVAARHVAKPEALPEPREQAAPKPEGNPHRGRKRSTRKGQRQKTARRAFRGTHRSESEQKKALSASLRKDR